MTLNDMLNSEEFQAWLSDRLGNDLCINDPERAERLREYAEEGLDGSTHYEHISDWREYVRDADFSEAQKQLLEKQIEDAYIFFEDRLDEIP